MNSGYGYARPEEDEEEGNRQAYDDYFNDAGAGEEATGMDDVYNENLGEDFEVMKI